MPDTVFFMDADLLNRISMDPEICHGKPCIRGHRIMVSVILDGLASGETVQDLLDDLPGLEEADVSACLAYASKRLREGFVTLAEQAT